MIKTNQSQRNLLINSPENKGIVKMIRVIEINHKIKRNKKYKQGLN